jgi:hypothetical protein
MNLSNCKTIEQYREAAHYWQKKWAKTDEELKKLKVRIECLEETIDGFQTQRYENTANRASDGC